MDESLDAKIRFWLMVYSWCIEGSSYLNTRLELQRTVLWRISHPLNIYHPLLLSDMITLNPPEIYSFIFPAFTTICLVVALLWKIRVQFRYLYLAYLEFIGHNIGSFRRLSLLEVLGYLGVNIGVIFAGSDLRDWYGNLKWMCVFNCGYAIWTGHNPYWLKLSPRLGYRMHFCSALTCLLEAAVYVGIVLARQSLGDYKWVYWTVSFRYHMPMKRRC